MEKYQFKPYIVEAVQLKIKENGIGNHQEVTNFVGKKLTIAYMGDVMLIPTASGEVPCYLNDYVVKDGEGNIHVFRREHFESNYDPLPIEETKINKNLLSCKVDITKTEVFMALIDAIKQIIFDTRIALPVRQEYLSELETVLQEKDH